MRTIMDSRSENEAFESSKNSVENEHSDIFIVPRIRKHRSCNYAQASIFLLCLTTSFCIILVAQQYSSKGRECVQRQSIYCSLFHFKPASILLLKLCTQIAQIFVNISTYLLFLSSSRARCFDGRLSNVDFQWHVPGLQPLQGTTKR